MERGPLSVRLPSLAFLKRQRLNRVHRALREANSMKVLMKQVAFTNGFTHLGQFSRDYRRIFCEAPSETLQLR